VFVDGLNLIKLGFSGVVPEATGRPSYHPSALLANSVGGRVRPSVFVVLRSMSGRTMARCGLRMMPPVGIEIERAPL